MSINDALIEMERGLKIARLFSEMTSDDLQTAVSDGINILRIIGLAPYGINLQQIAALNNRQDEKYTAAIVKLLIKGGMVIEYEEVANKQTLYKLA